MSQKLNRVKAAPAKKIQASCFLDVSASFESAPLRSLFRLDIDRTRAGSESRTYSRPDSRSPLDPSDRLSAQSQRVGSIQQPPLCPLQHPLLLHQIVQHRPSLRDILIYRVFALLQKRMFA